MKPKQSKVLHYISFRCATCGERFLYRSDGDGEGEWLERTMFWADMINHRAGHMLEGAKHGQT